MASSARRRGSEHIADASAHDASRSGAPASAIAPRDGRDRHAPLANGRDKEPARVTWKTDYEDLVATIVANQRDIDLDELCDRLGLLRDEVEAITDRLAARGTLDKLDA